VGANLWELSSTKKSWKNLLTNKKNYDIINIESEGKRNTKKFLKKIKKNG
jgi:hypothetical protein